MRWRHYDVAAQPNVLSPMENMTVAAFNKQATARHCSRVGVQRSLMVDLDKPVWLYMVDTSLFLMARAPMQALAEFRSSQNASTSPQEHSAPARDSPDGLGAQPPSAAQGVGENSAPPSGHKTFFSRPKSGVALPLIVLCATSVLRISSNESPLEFVQQFLLLLRNV